MYNRSSSSFHKKHIYNFEDEPPEKKMVSDADLFIKQLAEKQRNTKTSLEEQLSAKHEFYKATEIVPLTNYTSGSSSLSEFTSLVNQSDEIEKLKSNGLSNDDIQLFFDYKKGKEHFLNKHKNMNETILENRMKHIADKIHKSSENNPVKSIENTKDRLKTELVLSAKPTSIETKLLKFAIANQSKKEENFPHPMDSLKEIEKELTFDSNINTKKIRRKIRNLQKQIDSISSTQAQEPQIRHKNSSFSNNSQWDIKEPQSQRLEQEKVYSCKPQNYYTIRNGEIIQIKAPDINQKYFSNKLSIEEIKKNPKFANYTEGSPSKILYLKNLASQVTEEELKNIINEFSGKTVKSVKIMKGKMRGQAFVEAENEEVAESILKQCIGVLLHNKPIIIQFGKGPTLKSS